MREMLVHVYQHCNSRKSTQDLGKSPALMFVALDKLTNQGIKREQYYSMLKPKRQ